MNKYQYDPYECLYSVCRERKSIRDFLDRPVPGEAVEKIIAVARTAPYASNKKNWEILVVKDKEVIARIADAVQRTSDQAAKNLREDFRESFSLYADHFIRFRSAPVLLVPVFRIGKSFTFMMGDIEAGGNRGNMNNDSFSPAQWERDNYVKSISCVCMLILLAAQSLGLGSCLMTGPLLAEKEIHQIISVKKGRHIGAIIPIGYNQAEVNHGD